MSDRDDRVYNYPAFPPHMDEEDFVAFPDHLRVGERAPNGELVDAGGGETVRLGTYWRSGPCVIEFGSVT